jgi:hypothetical protein
VAADPLAALSERDPLSVMSQALQVVKHLQAAAMQALTLLSQVPQAVQHSQVAWLAVAPAL